MRNPDRTSELVGSRAAFAWGEHVNPRRLRTSLEAAKSPMLDVGCSGGAYVRAFRAHGLAAYGMDLLLPGDLASWNTGGYLVGELPLCPFPPNSFHTVTCFEVLEHLQDPGLGIRELARVTRDRLVVSVPDATRRPEHEASGYTYHHWLDRTHQAEFTPDSLRFHLEQAGLTLERLEGINPVTPEKLLVSQYRLPERVADLLVRLLKRVPGRRPRTMTLLAVARKARLP